MGRINGLLAAWILAGAVHASVIDEAIGWLAQRPGAELRPVYLSIEVPGHWLRQLSLSVGEQAPRRLRLDARQARALADGGLLRIAELPAGVGRVLVELRSSREADPAAPVDLVRRIELQRPDLDGARAWHLRLRRSAWRLWRAGLEVERVEPTAALDLAAAGLLIDGGQALEAALLLRRHQPLSVAAQCRLGDALAALGADGQAPWRAAALAGDGEAALRLAADLVEAGRLDQAARWLDRAEPGQAGSDRLRAVRLQLGRLTLDQLDDDALAAGPVALAAFNQAASSGATGALERLGVLAMRDPLGWALRDRANLALGYHYLDRREPGKAQAAFARVRAVGPDSAAGRLGLGWAQITPGGGPGFALAERQRPDLRPRGDAARAEARRATPFRTASGIAHGDLARRLRQALLPWTDLIGADPLDPAVQEAMLAIPYALSHLGAHEDALARTAEAAAFLQQLQQALAAVDETALLASVLGPPPEKGHRWWRQPQPPPGFYRERLLQVPAIGTLRRECLTLDELAQRVAAVGGQADLQGRLGRARQDCRGRLAARATRELVAWRDGLGRYLAEAHLALARLHDAERPVLAGVPE